MTTAPRAAIIAIGSEMLGPLRGDTNSLWLTRRLEEAGITVVRKSVVGDEPDEIARELSCAAATAGWIITTGGLGPTGDDVTVASVARWAERDVRRDEAFVAAMRKRWEQRGVPMPAVNEKQADFIDGARVLVNPRGTAPGFWFQKDGANVLILPGVPSEMREIFEQSVEPELRGTGAVTTRRRVLRIAGMAESAVEELVAPLYRKWSDDPVTILASPGEVELHLCARGDAAEAESRVAAMEADFAQVLAHRVHGRDGSDLAASVGRLLKEKGKTLAFAESCTGGLASALLTDVPGSSAYFLGSVVPYADAAKQAILGVAAETLRRHGAVSEEAAREMARGARDRFDSDLAASITGIAGPDGGSEQKPVGTVFFALAERSGRETAKRRLYGGDRATVRRASAMFSLEMIRRFVVVEP
ncbi:MAG TPA: competence/damage-inducible protein A [Thermoanaerobaculia bacterium]|jgi:nicotinamide-nucleotide amidase|nr:competence/damage-inducible protein A [Thermoanaerobaculia bacterium]HEV8610951.1 competence/damage-inducible protein A [Thermoanaerobaculia bacterium]